ncbi:MAG: hypothetical protein ACLT46_05710 [Hungatella sp.]
MKAMYVVVFTQRFYIPAEPEHFDIALGIYDKLRREKRHTAA